MPKLTLIDRAIAALDGKIAALQLARAELLAQQQKTVVRKPKPVAVAK